MILIFSAFGATKNYPDQEIMRKTLSAFIGSVMGQNDRDFRLFLVGHDRPDLPQDDALIWSSLSCGEGYDYEATLLPEELPRKITDEIKYVPVLGKGKMDDMSRKVQHGVIQAARWAHENGLREFWMMRMDSDDLLAVDTVRTIHRFDGEGYRAIFNRTCHMFDVRTRRIAVHYYPTSNTPNALKFRINDDGTLTPDWFYLCYNHTFFPGRVRKDGIPCREADWVYCIVTNTGNSISGRPSLDRVERTTEVPLTRELIERYGIGKLL